MSRNWVFAARPAGSCVVRQSAREMAPGDRVFHWTQEGLLGVSEMTSSIHQDEQGQVVVDLREVRLLSQPLDRETFAADPDLARAAFLNSPGKVNYLVDDLLAARLSRLVGMEPLWGFDPVKLAEVLELRFDDPRLMSAAGWKQEVGTFVTPFFEALKASVGATWQIASRGTVKTQRQHHATMNCNNVYVFLGLDAPTDAERHFLFAGYSFWGKEPEARREMDLLEKKQLPPGWERRMQKTWVFGGHAAMFGLFLSPGQIREMTPEVLLDTTAAALRQALEGNASPANPSPANATTNTDELAQLYARSKQDLTFWEAWRDRMQQREARLPIISEALSEFQRTNDLETFRRFMDNESRQHNLWGFGGTSGQMFLNLWLRAEERTGTALGVTLARESSVPADPEELEASLRRAVAVLAEARALPGGGIQGFFAGHLPYLLSYLWQVREPLRWPVLWTTSLRPFLSKHGLLSAQRDPISWFLAYLRGAAALRVVLEASSLWDSWAVDHPWWEVEGLSVWARDLVEPPPPDGGLVDALHRFCLSRGFHFPPEILISYLLALQSKPFVIFSGISGTGKTKLAELFAAFVSPTIAPPAKPATASSGPFMVTQLRPFTHKYRRLYIPVEHWQHFPPLEPGDHEMVKLQTPLGASEAKLINFKMESRPEGSLQLYLRGGALDWVRSLKLGQPIAWTREVEGYRLTSGDLSTEQPAVARTPWAFVPVRPDWTDSRGLVGFAHVLSGTYQATDFLRLLLRARVDPDRWPHFVLLDEMNLARVEHYFSDFLSALETRKLAPDQTTVEQEPFSLHDHPRCILQAGAEDPAAEFFDAEANVKTCRVRCAGCPWADLVDTRYHGAGETDYADAHRAGFDPVLFAPPRLRIPWNVFFTGSVNVDETTYSFSPKVLDRAHVLEFSEVNLESYLQSPPVLGHAVCATAEMVNQWTRGFTYPFSQVGRDRGLRSPELAPYLNQLVGLNRWLQADNLHFGYRVADEILTFLQNAVDLAEPRFPLERAFDRVLLQKLLTRFYGSQAKLRRPLLGLIAFCELQPDEEATAELVESTVRERAAAFSLRSHTELRQELEFNLRLRESGLKALRMLRDLELDGFASSL